MQPSIENKYSLIKIILKIIHYYQWKRARKFSKRFDQGPVFYYCKYKKDNNEKIYEKISHMKKT